MGRSDFRNCIWPPFQFVVEGSVGLLDSDRVTIRVFTVLPFWVGSGFQALMAFCPGFGRAFGPR